MIHELIINTFKSEKTCNNKLTDGQFTCSYKELLSVFDRIDNYFEEYKISSKNCFSFCCSNSIFSAILLLWFICRKRSFVLLSPLSRKSKGESTDITHPLFCKYIVDVNYNSDNVDLYSPDTYINTNTNKSYDREATAPERQGMVYFKTSGSMASPKLVVHTGENLAGNIMNCVERFRLNYLDRVTIPVPIFHMYGFGAAFIPAVVAGALIDIQENTNVIKYLDRERKFNPTKAYLTPGLCEMFLMARKNPRHYELVITAGDRISQKNFVKFEKGFGKLINLYGSTELGAVATSYPDDPLEERAKGHLKLLDGITKRVKETKPKINEDDNIGEIYFNHKYGFRGYVDEKGRPIQQEGENNEWFPSKDIASILPEGDFKILGRCDNSVNRNGLLLPLAEVENAMERINGLNRVMAIAHGESKRGKSIMVFCVLDKGVTLNNDDIKRQCFNILPAYAIPDKFFVLKEFPRLPNGKIDMQTLLRNYISNGL